MVTSVTRARFARPSRCAQAGYSVLETLVAVGLAGIKITEINRQRAQTTARLKSIR